MKILVALGQSGTSKLCAFEENNIQSFFQDAYLHGSEEIKKNDGSKYQVFTPYYNKWKEAPKETPIPVSYTAEKFLVRVFFQKRKQLIVNRLRGFL